jgi:hypothetical protein
MVGQTSQLDSTKVVSNAFIGAPPTFLPLQDIPERELQIFKDSLCE